MRHFLFIDEEIGELQVENINGKAIRELRAILDHIACKGWKPAQPKLASHAVLIERASWHCRGDVYTIDDFRNLYDVLRQTQELKPFSDMTAVDFLEALEPQVAIRRVA